MQISGVLYLLGGLNMSNSSRVTDALKHFSFRVDSVTMTANNLRDSFFFHSNTVKPIAKLQIFFENLIKKRSKL